jgi:hypothetical protein
MLDVSTSIPSLTPEDVSDMLNDHTKHMIDQLKYMIEDVLIFFKTLSISSDPYSVSGTPQAPSTLAPLEPSENPLYGMPRVLHLAKHLQL